MKKVDVKLVLIAALIVVGIFVFYTSQTDKPTVTTVGNYKTNVQPDQVVVYLSIQTKNNSAEAAKNENARISNNVLNALKDAGIGSRDVETENYNIYPEYNWTSGKQEIIGYTASNNIKITTKDLDKSGKIIDVSVDNGALVSYINFELSVARNNEVKALVLANASLDAKTKAEAIATGLSKNVGRITSISTSDYYYQPYPVYRAEESTGDVKTIATNIQPKNLEVSAIVTVTFEIV